MEKNNFDEIEELEEVADAEEFEELEVVNEEFDETAAPTSNKPVKAKKKKKLALGLGITAAVLVVIIVAVVVLLVVLKGKDFGKQTQTFGPSDANAATNTKLDDENLAQEMTPFQMMTIAIDNYNKAAFAANICEVGGVQTKIAFIEVNQTVQSLKVKVGATGAPGTRYFAYSKSGGIANMVEEYYMNADGTIKYRSANKAGKDSKTGRVYVDSWKDTESYQNIDEFIEANTTDFTKFWSYLVTEETVVPANKEVGGIQNKGEYWEFTISVDISNPAAVADYKKVMGQQLGKNMGMNVASIDFTRLDLRFEVYKNGDIRTLQINESYVMNLTNVPVINKLNGMGINNQYTNSFWFDPSIKVHYDTLGTEEAYIDATIDDLVKLF